MSMFESPGRPVWALVPVKAFCEAKTRLATVMSASQRAGLQRAMLCDVLAALTSSRWVDAVAVIGADAEIASIAAAHDVRFLLEPDECTDLSSAVESGVRTLMSCGAGMVMIVPADIPGADADEIDRIVQLASDSGANIVVPDRHRDGTNALLVHAHRPVDFSYGPGSFGRHMQANGGRAPIVAQLRSLQLDIDLPADLAELAASCAGEHASLTRAFLLARQRHGEADRMECS